MDVLFVHPNASKKIYQDLSKDLSAIEPPIWAALLANHVRSKGYATGILDTEALRLDVPSQVSEILARKPKLVTVVVYGQQPSASTQNMTGASAITRALKEAAPELPVMLLGLYPSALPEKTMNDETCDFVCQGEGVDTLDALLSLQGKHDPSNLKKVPGLWFRDNGHIVQGPPSTIVPAQDLARVLPGMAWDMLPMANYRTSNWHAFSNNNQKSPFAALYTSLGCPFKCSFCCINAPFGGSSFRHWDPEFMITEFDKIADMGITNIKIADEMFVMKVDHFLKLCELIHKRGHHFNIWAYARIDTVKEQYLETLKKAGVNWLALGIESGVKNVRTDVVKGRFDEVNIVDVVKKIRSYDISVIGNYIFGLPEDTVETMEQTLQMALEMNTEFTNFYSCMAYPGSTLHRTAVEQKMPLPDSYEGFSQHSYETLPLPTKHIGSREVLKFRDEAFMRYNTDKGYLDYLAKRFGQGTVDEINNMTKIKLKRKLLDAAG